MKKDIIIAGVGGQGILSIAAVIGHAALSQGLHVKQAEVHGMSQRGGDVHSDLRIDSRPVASDLIPKGCADVIVAMEPMEALRYLPWLSAHGWVVANTTPFVNIPNYPDPAEVLAALRALPRVILLDAEGISKRGANMALLGAASYVLDLVGLNEAVRDFFAPKGEQVAQSNALAFREGYKLAVDQYKAGNSLKIRKKKAKKNKSVKK